MASTGTPAIEPSARSNGVTIEEIETLLLGEPRVAPDLEHSKHEERLIAVGRSPHGRALFVVFTVRHRDGRRLFAH
jgi:uncharacterized DUF497 family protein